MRYVPIFMVVSICAVFLKPAWADESASKQIQMLNSQIQSQLQAMHLKNQEQIKTLNNQVQEQLQELHKSTQSMVAKLNQQLSAQIKKVESDLQAEIQQVQANVTKSK